MFAKLALRNIKRQIRDYLIYFVTVVLSVALMFAVNNLSYSDRIRQLAEISSDIKTMFNMVTILSSLVTALVLSYATTFMLKLRKKEFGMYLTLGMTRRNILTLFVCETWLLSGIALVVGIGLGLVIYQLMVALFASIMDFTFAISAYSYQGIALTVAVSVGLFALSTLVSMRYLKKVTISELLKEENAERSEKHPVFWCVFSVVTLAGLIGSLIITYQSLMAVFYNQEGLGVLLWLLLDLVMTFLVHFSLSRTIAGMLLRNRRLKNRGTNTVILRGLSGKMTVNSLLIGALATLLVFAIGMSNMSFAEKIYSDYSTNKECPYDVMALYDVYEESETSKGNGFSIEEGRRIIEAYSPITSQIEYHMHSLGETTLGGDIMIYGQGGRIDRFMPLSQFNMLLVDCGYEPIALDKEYMLLTSMLEICDVDLSDKTVNLNGTIYSWAGSSTFYPEFVKGWYYFVIPDKAVENIPVSNNCVGYTLENDRPDAQNLTQALRYTVETEDGPVERSNYRVREYYRLYSKTTAGTLIIGTLYVSTVFVCMALAILALKTLSTLNEESRRYAVLYRLGADVKMQKSALFRQIGAFFLMPFGLPLVLTVPVGVIFGEIYEIWGFVDLSGQKAMETAVLIALVVAGVYTLYFFITYRIACEHVICHGNERQV